MPTPPAGATTARPGRAAYHHGDLPAALTAAALQLVSERGADAFSLREAAARVGVSPSAAYKHFADKDELLAAVARHGFAMLASTTEEAMLAARARHRTAKARAVAAWEANGLAYVRFAIAQPAHFQLMFGSHGAGSGRVVRGTSSSGLDPYQLLTKALDDLHAAGAIAPERREGAELTAWSAMHGLTCIVIGRALIDPDRLDVEKAVLRTARTVLRGLADGH